MAGEVSLRCHHGNVLLSNPMKKLLSSPATDALLTTLAERFSQHPNRHKKLDWPKVQERLIAHPEKLWSLAEMERTGGEPDVIGVDAASGAYRFVDCSAETPKGRVSVCYDRAGLESRKEHKPQTSAQELAAAMGIRLLTETEYLDLQKLGEFDRKTSSWVETPEAVRQLGGALYGELRYGRIFIGHNGAQSYYAVRGFRGILLV